MDRRNFFKKSGILTGALALSYCDNSHYYWDSLIPKDSLVLWLRADAGVITDASNTLTQWTDQSGNNNHAYISTNTPKYSSNGINGYPAIQFVSANPDRLIVNSVTLSSFTVFSVFKMSPPAGGIIYEQSINANSNDGSYFATSTGWTSHVRRNTTDSSQNLSVSWGVDNNSKIATHIYNGTHTSHKIYINGSENTYTGGVTNDPGTLSVTNSIYIGARQDNSFPCEGYIGELIVYNRFLSDNERASVENTLSFRFGISI